LPRQRVPNNIQITLFNTVEETLKRFMASVNYASKLADGTRQYAQPFFFTADDEREAGKIVQAIADFAALTLAPDVHIQYAESGTLMKEFPRAAI